MCSYLVLLLLISHAIGGGWSGVASLGVAAYVFISIPYFVGMVIYFKTNSEVAANNQLLYRLSAAFPVCFVGYFSISYLGMYLGAE